MSAFWKALIVVAAARLKETEMTSVVVDGKECPAVVLNHVVVAYKE